MQPEPITARQTQHAEPARPSALALLRNACRVRHYSLATERLYVQWLRRFSRFHTGRPVSGMGAEEIRAFLTHLAVAGRVSASTQNQALCALVFFYTKVLAIALDGIDATRAKRKPRLPTVLTRTEVGALLSNLHGAAWLRVALLYGSGLRQSEVLRLRVKDLDLERRVITVRGGKGDKDRVVMLPAVAVEPLRAHLAAVAQPVHARDRAAGVGVSGLPDAFSRKAPGADCSWPWAYVFPAAATSIDPRSGERRRHHLHATALGREVRQAARAAGIAKRVTCHTLRHSFATHLLASGRNVREVQELLGHASVETTMVYTHLLGPAAELPSPLDRLQESGQ